MFWDSLPNYLAIGMSSEEFWHGEPRLAASYREAERIRRENRMIAEWRAGVYAYEAMLAASPAFRELSKGVEHPYPQKPLFSTIRAEKAKREDPLKAEMERKREAFMAMAIKANARLARGEERTKGEVPLSFG